ncbi:hypothetical protein GDO81_010474 [Engystomops pustulosus]|uniref:Biopterin-dependent aromatic amino acid hydroxylase family profile domain-containing protein n=1 Tax=Engystomops pustulosus TaxID=76066 RepID=A0AAV7C123_ENGPU|nr:hypothetical protein GDO81_010474 [Engystomops pustulosus]
MKSEVGTSQCRKQSLIEDARKEKEISEVTTSDPPDDTFDHPDEGSSTLYLIFTVSNTSVSPFSTSLKTFEKHGAIIYHIETRPAGQCKMKGEELECFVKCFIHNSSTCSLLSSLKKIAGNVKVIKDLSAPSFPRKVQDLDMCQHLSMKFEPDFDKDHPGFGDQEYKKRRGYFAELAFKYKYGNVIPRVEYTSEEIATWKQVYKSLSSLYPNYACKQYLETFQQLEKYCGYTEDSIPQLQDVSNFLKERTGFILRPAAGLLSARDFLACLAFRVFPKKLYWFTIEFGLCKQNGSIKAYGAGLLSSYGELMYALSNKPALKNFDPEFTAVHPYQDNSYQPVYFISESFEDSTVKLRQYALKMKKPFCLRYDPFTCSVEILDTFQKVRTALCEIKEELKNLCSALDKIC